MHEEEVVRAVPEFEAFYRHEYRGVLGLAMVLCTRGSAEDVTQDAFVAAYERWDEVGQMENAAGWVRRVAMNRALSRFRRAAAEGRALIRVSQPFEAPGVSTDSLAVWMAIRRLSKRQAMTVVLAYYEGLEQAEIAQLCGCSIETVRTHLKRAKARLRHLLED